MKLDEQEADSHTMKTHELVDKILSMDDKTSVLALLEELEATDADGFTSVVSNPPYQMETAVKEGQEQPTVTNVFHEFQTLASVLGSKTSMIYPAGRWIQRSGKGLKEFGKRLINDPHLRSLEVYPGEGPEAIFDTARLPGGVSIVFWDSDFENNGSFSFNGRLVDAPGDAILPLDPALAPIVQKMRERAGCFLFQKASARSLFGIESNHVELYPDTAFLQATHPEPPSSLDDPVLVFTNDKAGKGGKPAWFWMSRASIPRSHEIIDRWQVVTQSAIFEGVAFYFTIIGPGKAHGRVRVSVRDFATEAEAKNFLSYMETSFSKRLLRGSESGGLSSLGAFVPDLEDYTTGNSHIDWTKALEPQLYKLFELTEEEIAVVEGVSNGKD